MIGKKLDSFVRKRLFSEYLIRMGNRFAVLCSFALALGASLSAAARLVELNSLILHFAVYSLLSSLPLFLALPASRRHAEAALNEADELCAIQSFYFTGDASVREFLGANIGKLIEKRKGEGLPRFALDRPARRSIFLALGVLIVCQALSLGATGSFSLPFTLRPQERAPLAGAGPEAPKIDLSLKLLPSLEEEKKKTETGSLAQERPEKEDENFEGLGQGPRDPKAARKRMGGEESEEFLEEEGRGTEAGESPEKGKEKGGEESPERGVESMNGQKPGWEGSGESFVPSPVPEYDSITETVKAKEGGQELAASRVRSMLKTPEATEAFFESYDLPIENSAFSDPFLEGLRRKWRSLRGEGQ